MRNISNIQIAYLITITPAARGWMGGKRGGRKRGQIFLRAIVIPIRYIINYLKTHACPGQWSDACWQTCLANARTHTQPPLLSLFLALTPPRREIHAGRFSWPALPRASLYIRRRRLLMIRDADQSAATRRASQMACDRSQLHGRAPINYYQTVCHLHETINSVGSVHRRADKLSRPTALVHLPTSSSPTLPSLLRVHFLLPISRRYFNMPGSV